MPKGVPKSGIRSPGAGSKKRFAGELKQKWIPPVVANNLDNTYRLLNELVDEVNKWEKICNEKSTSPRYEQARKLTNTLRTMLDNLGFNPKDIYVDSKQDNNKG
ncbi:hypothetical protein IQ244_08980 [Nostoc sp. LEGE 06077]|uniref:hypothetical protein n=1 Tax=Nostoc sp. LEGE 06077 TaxID=915325 RepID=UPI00187F1FF2|nr:hypothetical protein [Nostoc sp. LEGE 06077]MBE9206644.1 hypothetical protein [Nostoc sp. LEGE 06077]